MNETVAPDNKAPNKEEIKFRCARLYIDLAEDIAQHQTKPVSEVYREAIERGLRTMAEEDGKLFVREKSKRRVGAIDEAIALLQLAADEGDTTKVESAIALLKAATGS